ncbi:NUDIX hydrolase [Streptomyces sp. NBC_00102]|uniref:NUDIX hydrolase n=1 Tax=Streptomyces sp. NBC_00102 TaxID=2975652 RepID=UPI00224FEBF7|nr:NUDIX domain-containing protein [Streptomyces sp. NBC_00102]MCX5400330.1 NUDIX domain-containing protein [Streptomyces sp. NBC_00102]
MSRHELDQLILDEAAEDARSAVWEFDSARIWLDEARQRPMEPLAAEVWVTDPGAKYIVLVKHRVRGWVPPGGEVERYETPRQGAARELLEETGLRVELHAEPAAVTVRSYRPDLSPTLGLSYTATVERDAPLVGEQGQPAAWFDLDTEWDSVFPEDRERIRAHARRLTAGRRPGSS